MLIRKGKIKSCILRLFFGFFFKASGFETAGVIGVVQLFGNAIRLVDVIISVRRVDFCGERERSSGFLSRHGDHKSLLLEASANENYIRKGNISASHWTKAHYPGTTREPHGVCTASVAMATP